MLCVFRHGYVEKMTDPVSVGLVLPTRFFGSGLVQLRRMNSPDFSQRGKGFVGGAAVITMFAGAAFTLVLIAIALAKNVESNPTTPADKSNQETVTGCLSAILALTGASVITLIVLFSPKDKIRLRGHGFIYSQEQLRPGTQQGNRHARLHHRAHGFYPQGYQPNPQ